ncbi:MAG TPA: hypothetical protein DDW87_09920 [Firmicutes bacterium]|nr:hypothetical protein [Bacillota bacterium]
MALVLLPGKKLGSRTLRLGHNGADVLQLHAFLRLQGYDLGDERDYGYLTKDAVARWQRDHGLVADGIAGKRFFALALRENLPIRRRVHVVAPNESLEQIAAIYGVGVQAFQRSCRNGQVYPGQHLVFFDREIWGLCTTTPKGDMPRGTLTGLVCKEPPSSEQLPLIIRPASQENGDVAKVHQHLRSAGRRKRAAGAFLASLQEGSGCKGLYLPWTSVAPLDGRRYLALLKILRKQLKAPRMLWVELGPQIPTWKFWGGVDYSRVNELVDRVVLELPSPAQPGPLVDREQAEELVGTLLPCVHSWKILLKVPVFALEWQIGAEGSQAIRLPYQTALSRAFRHGARLAQDEQQMAYYHYKKRGSEYHVRLPHHSYMAEMAAVANRYNLAGLILDSLGMEDPRIWQTLNAHFRTASLIISNE